MHDEECAQPVACDFEDHEFDFCSWLNEESTDDFDWEALWPVFSSDYPDILDHTYDSTTGRLAIG